MLIIVLYIFIFIFLNSKLDDKIFCTEWQQAFLDCNLLSFSLWIEIFSLNFSPNIWTVPTLNISWNWQNIYRVIKKIIVNKWHIHAFVFCSWILRKYLVIVPPHFVIFISHLDPSRCHYDPSSLKVSLSLSTYKIKFQNSQLFYYYYYYHHHHHHRVSHFSALAGKYSPILGCSNQQY